MQPIKIGAEYIHRKTGAKSRVIDVKKKKWSKLNYIFYVDMDAKPFQSNYTMSLPEDTFLKRYKIKGEDDV